MLYKADIEADCGTVDVEKEEGEQKGLRIYRPIRLLPSSSRVLLQDSPRTCLVVYLLPAFIHAKPLQASLEKKQEISPPSSDLCPGISCYRERWLSACACHCKRRMGQAGSRVSSHCWMDRLLAPCGVKTGSSNFGGCASISRPQHYEICCSSTRST